MCGRAGLERTELGVPGQTPGQTYRKRHGLHGGLTCVRFEVMKIPNHKRHWEAGKCSVEGCGFTLVTYVGGGQWWCWLHALLEDLV